jgi:hypothetical protein
VRPEISHAATPRVETNNLIFIVKMATGTRNELNRTRRALENHCTFSLASDELGWLVMAEKRWNGGGGRKTATAAIDAIGR